MSKKRRDKERDPSTKKRTLGYVKGAAAVATTAAFLNRVGGRDIVALNRTAKHIQGDLLGNKKNLKNLTNTYARRIGTSAEKYKDTRNNIRWNNTGNFANKEKIRVNNITDGIFGIIKESEEARHNRKNYVEYRKGKEIINLQKQTINRYENSFGKLSDKDKSIVKNVIYDSFNLSEKDKGLFKNGDELLKHPDFYEKTFGKFDNQVLVTQMPNLFSDTYNSAMSFKEMSKSTEFQRLAKEYTESRSALLLDPENIKKHLSKKDKAYDRINKSINNLTGLDVDVEYALHGTRAATFKDLSEFMQNNPDAFDESSLLSLTKNNKNKHIQLNLKREFENLMSDPDKFEQLKDVRVGHGLRATLDESGATQLFSTQEYDNIFGKAMSSFADTLPGRLFKGIDFKQMAKNPYSAHFRAGTIDRLALLEDKIVNGEVVKKQAGDRIEESYDYIAGNLYKLSEVGGNLSYSKVSDENMDRIGGGITLISEDHGSFSRIVKDMLGSDRIAANTNDNKFLKKLDIGQTARPNIAQRIKAVLTKGEDPNWARNKMINANDMLFEGINADDLSPLELIQKASAFKEVDKALGDHTAINNITDDTLMALLKHNSTVITGDETINKTVSDESKNLLRLLLKGNIGEGLVSEEAFEQSSVGIRNYNTILSALANNYASETNDAYKLVENIQNKQLSGLVETFIQDVKKTDDILDISTKNNKILGLGIEMPRTTVFEIDDIARREVLKEVLYKEFKASNDPDVINQFINSMDISKNQKHGLQSLVNWSILQNEVITETSDNVLGAAKETLDNVNRLQANGSKFASNLYNNLSTVIQEDYSFASKPHFGNLAENYYTDYNQYMTLKKTNVFDALADMNADTFMKAGKEMFAGRNSIENVSVATMFPYHSAARLSYAVEELGLGLSSDSMKSALDVAKNIGLKRVLPMGLALNALSYLDYESENITGTSLRAAAAGGVANIDLTARKVLDATGLSKPIDWIKESNPFGEYWTGEQNFQSYDERMDWYENGYSPVRSSRFWAFGSASEYRGGGISYWQPNFLRRANSDWRDVGIYGSSEDKWKHSLMPTLRHPLSTINYLLDPYWLEKKNMDERPYPYTAKMFSEGTPWGAVLNPTIGEIIKPVKMLPEIRKRLQGGVDTKQILYTMNERLRAKKSEDDNILIFKDTDVRNGVYTSYAHATPGYTNINFSNGDGYMPGNNYMASVNDLRYINKEQLIPSADLMDGLESAASIGAGMTVASPGGDNQYKAGGSIRRFIDGVVGHISNQDDVVNMLRVNNNAIKQQAMSVGYMGADKPTEGVLIYNNPVGNKIVDNNNFYERKHSSDALKTSKHEDYMNDAIFSMKQLSGIYGFLGDVAFGETSYSPRLANAGDMASFSRGFWDSSMGGFGGEFMEIARRFFPHEDRSRPSYNPLVNTMPEWLPERFRFGDAFAALPKGEMRLPGRGYETIYDLHPDQFATDGYGAFDRMKILADIAPSSEEYKTWRKIAQQTVSDPNLLKEMKAIEERSQRAMLDHDFYEYRTIKNPTEMHKGVVKEINEDGSIKLSSGINIKLAGVDIEAMNLSEMLRAGQNITYRTTKNVQSTYDEPMSAIVYTENPLPRVANNINKEVVDNGLGQRDKTDRSGLAYLGQMSSGQEVIGAPLELLAHAQIPILHNKFFKIESAMESYKNEMIYGSSFATWDHPIEGFVKPMLNQQFRKDIVGEAIGLGTWKLFNHAMENSNLGGRMGASLAMAAVNPSAMLGMGIGFGLKLNFGGDVIKHGANVGMAVGTVGWGIANADNPLKAMASFGGASYYLARRFEIEEYLQEITKVAGPPTKEVLESGVKDIEKKLVRIFGENFTAKKAAVLGAGVGLAVSALKNPDFDWNRLTGDYIPKGTKERWEMEEYFDRLEYIKYMGLYNEASRRAQVLEGTNVRRLFNQIDKNKKEISKLQRKANKVSNKYTEGSSVRDIELANIQEKINQLQTPEQIVKSGKWAKAAVAYKKMAESTIYGLDETSTIDELMRAVPNRYGDYVKAFAEEDNKSKRKEILRNSSEGMQKVLKLAWGEKPNKLTKNGEYFRFHKLPGMTWKGWKPSVDMKHVQMKTIQNEGMLLSDFGFYESEKGKASYYEAPDIEEYDKKGFNLGIVSRAKIMTELGGFGLGLENVSVEPSSTPGLWILGDINRTASEMGTLATNKLDSVFTNLLL